MAIFASVYFCRGKVKCCFDIIYDRFVIDPILKQSFFSVFNSLLTTCKHVGQNVGPDLDSKIKTL